MEIETLLYEEIVDEFGNLEDLEAGSEEYKATVDGLVKLMDRAIEIEKIHKDEEERDKDRQFDQDLKLKQVEEETRDRLIKNCIAVAGIVIPSLVTMWGAIKSFKFEKDGTYTTVIGRGFINKLLPKK